MLLTPRSHLPNLILTWRNLSILIAFIGNVGGQDCLARGSSPVYEDPFDIGSGGASLTRASQAGMMFSNPALLAIGPGFHRWLGNEITAIVGKDSVDFAKGLQSGQSQSNDSSQAQFVESVLSTPLHAGLLNNFSYINRFAGISTFSRAEFDIAAKKYGDTGLPAIRFRAESYQGVGASFAAATYSQLFSVGATAKYIIAGEPDLAIELTDQQAISNLQSPNGLKSLIGLNTGIGIDAGALMFLQGYSTDYRIAFKIDDFGGTKLTGDGSLKEFRQIQNLGLGVTFHNSIDSIHLSLDLRDLSNSYHEQYFRKVRLGTKILLRQRLGVGCGYYDGWPSYSLELDAFILRMTATYYTRELGSKPGIDPRSIYMLGLTMGI